MLTRDLELIVDLQHPKTYTTTTYVQNDTDTGMIFGEIQKAGERVSLTGLYITFSFMLPNKTVFKDSNVVITDELMGKFEYKIPNHVLSTVGQVQGMIHVYNDAGARLSTSTTFNFKVTSDFGANESIETSDNYPILTKLITDVTQLADNITVNETKRDELYRQAELNRDASYEAKIIEHQKRLADELAIRVANELGTLEGIIVQLEDLTSEVV